MLRPEQIDFYHQNGYLHIPQLFSKEEIDELADELDRLVEDWSFTSEGWTGPWRLAYMDPETEKRSKLTAMHDLHLYSNAWTRAVANPRLADAFRRSARAQRRAAPHHHAHQAAPDRAPLPPCIRTTLSTPTKTRSSSMC